LRILKRKEKTCISLPAATLEEEEEEEEEAASRAPVDLN